VKTKSIDNYICLNVDQIVIDEMNNIINNKFDDPINSEEAAYWAKLIESAKVILGYYTV
jgi:hypothetical protein